MTYPDGSIEICEFFENLKQGVGVKRKPIFQELPVSSNVLENFEYFYITWKASEIINEIKTDKLNFDNYYWYDEGGLTTNIY